VQESDKKRFILFAKYGRDYLDLDYKVDTKFGYIGPQIFFRGIWYRFSEPVLHLLSSRFFAINGAQNVSLITRWDLLKLMDDIPENNVFEVGGDALEDPPFYKYLPEIQDDDDFHEKLVRIRCTHSAEGMGRKIGLPAGQYPRSDQIIDGWGFNATRGLWEEDF
jgi:hypothetical protein